MSKKIWIWIISGLLLVLGVLGYLYIKAKSYGMQELYGAPLYRPE